MADFKQGYSAVLTKAWSDDSYAKELRSNPKQALAEAGLDVPDDATVEIVSNVAGSGDFDDQAKLWEDGSKTGTYKLYVPEVPQLDDEGLDEAKATSDTSYCCCCCPCCTCT